MTPLGLLEPSAVQVARSVLRGPRRSNAPGLPGDNDGRTKSIAGPGGTLSYNYYPAGTPDEAGLMS